MIIDCVSDLHGYYPQLEGADLLIVAGDFCANDTLAQINRFKDWMIGESMKYKKTAMAAGNHDNWIQRREFFNKDTSNPTIQLISYLEDSYTEFEGLKIYGTPWTKTFPGMNPHCRAFTCDTEEELAEKWALIPSDVDILITHSPPMTVLDTTVGHKQAGSYFLMAEHLERLRPKLWVFGHIHEGYGQDGPYKWNNTRYVNASHVNERYEPVNKPIRIEL